MTTGILVALSAIISALVTWLYMRRVMAHRVRRAHDRAEEQYHVGHQRGYAAGQKHAAADAAMSYDRGVKDGEARTRQPRDKGRFAKKAAPQPMAPKRSNEPRSVQLSRFLFLGRLALPILDDELTVFESDTPPDTFKKRGFVCLADIHCDHSRWVECERLLTALAAIRDVLPAEEWADTTYATTQAAVEHFKPAIVELPPPAEELERSHPDACI